jgi:hypothetical protein
MGFIPSVISTLRGIGNGLWALTKDPVAMSLEFANAAIQCIEYIKSHSTDAIIQDMVPELKELLQTYEQLDDFEKGKLIGHVIGKYGLDIFLAKQGVSFIKSYRELKQANHLMTLEALSSSQHNFKILEEAGKRWTLRESVLKNGVLKIHEGRQNKHIFKYMKQGDTRSILTYPDPQNS